MKASEWRIQPNYTTLRKVPEDKIVEGQTESVEAANRVLE